VGLLAAHPRRHPRHGEGRTAGVKASNCVRLGFGSAHGAAQSAVIARLDRAIQYAETFRFYHHRRAGR
jgi:hypothetical protein